MIGVDEELFPYASTWLTWHDHRGISERDREIALDIISTNAERAVWRFRPYWHPIAAACRCGGCE